MKLLWKAVIFGISFIPTFGVSQDIDLTLTVSGSISSSPRWQDGSSSEINYLDFDFSNFAGSVSAVNVDSSTENILLSDSSQTGNTLSIALTRPSDCDIGANNVHDADVFFMNGGSEVTTNTTINFTEGVLKTVGIRFSDTGNHGANSGVVRCSVDGNLRYTY